MDRLQVGGMLQRARKPISGKPTCRQHLALPLFLNQEQLDLYESCFGSTLQSHHQWCNIWNDCNSGVVYLYSEIVLLRNSQTKLALAFGKQLLNSSGSVLTARKHLGFPTFMVHRTWGKFRTYPFLQLYAYQNRPTQNSEHMTVQRTHMLGFTFFFFFRQRANRIVRDH